LGAGAAFRGAAANCGPSNDNINAKEVPQRIRSFSAWSVNAR
jgi:hypothetical protein